MSNLLFIYPIRSQHRIMLSALLSKKQEHSTKMTIYVHKKSAQPSADNGKRNASSTAAWSIQYRLNLLIDHTYPEHCLVRIPGRNASSAAYGSVHPILSWQPLSPPSGPQIATLPQTASFRDAGAEPARCTLPQ